MSAITSASMGFGRVGAGGTLPGVGVLLPADALPAPTLLLVPGLVSPIKTVGQPTVIVPPWAVMSPMRAAGFPPIKTPVEPSTTVEGGPTQTHMSPITAAGMPPINTVGQPGPVIGPPTCGIGGSPGVTIGHMCISPTRAAGFPMVS